MTSRKPYRNLLPALLFLLLGWTGAAMADPSQASLVQGPAEQTLQVAPSPEHLAWQRVGDPIREA